FVRSIALFVPGTVIEGEHIEQFQDFFSDGEMGELTPALVEVLDDTMNSRARSLLDTELPENELADEAAERPEPVVSGTNADVDPEVAVVDNVIRGEFGLAEMKKRLEIECIRRALIETGGNITQA